MATVVELPRLSDTMEEGVIARWRIKVGDKVKRGQVIAEIETDKATMEFESFDSGTVLKLIATEGETLPLLVALSGWDTEKDAVEAEQAAQKLVQNLTGKSSDKLPPPGKSPLFERHSGDRSFAVARRGQKLLIVCGVPSVSTSTVVAEIFRSWNAVPIGQVAP